MVCRQSRKKTRPLKSTQSLLGFALGLLGVIIFGATLPMTSLAVQEIDPYVVTTGRATLAGLAALFTILLCRCKIPYGHFATLFWIGLLLIVGFPGMTALAMQTVPASHGGIVLALLPLATALAAVLVTGERPSGRFWLFAIAGAGLVLIFVVREADGAIATGDLWLLAATLCAALGYALSGRIARQMPGWQVISWALVLWMPLSALLFLFSDRPALETISPSATGAFLYLGIFSQFLGFFAWNAGLAIGGVAKVGQMQLLQTFVTLFFSALLLGEMIDGITIVFAIAVAVLVALGRNAPVRRKAATP